jgi:pimeloyl-ACP methyl ester carboxylesterase
VKRVIAAGPNNGKQGFNIPPDIPLDSVRAPSLKQFAEWNRQAIEDYSKTPGRDWKKLVNALNTMWYTDEYFPVTVYARIRIPVMIILGDQDDISIEHGLEMHRAIKGSQFCVLPGTTHDVFNERSVWITNIAIDFLK